MIGGDGINDESNKTAPAPTRNTDLTKYSLTDADLQAIVQEMNDTPHEGPGLGNTQRGLVPRARQANVEDKPPKDEHCTYKLNPGQPLANNVSVHYMSATF